MAGKKKPEVIATLSVKRYRAVHNALPALLARHAAPIPAS